LYYEFIDPSDQITSADFAEVESFLRDTGRTQIGWHYITDLTWLYRRARHWPNRLCILDAGGGGNGPLQFLLAELGHHVVNMDLHFPELPASYRRRYGTRLRHLPSHTSTDYVALLAPNTRAERLKAMIKRTALYRTWRGWSEGQQYAARHDAWRARHGLAHRDVGRIEWVRANLCAAPEMQSNSFDAVVSLSALEHVPLDLLPQALAEIRRLARPDAHWAVTTSGTEQERTWFHEPSRGHCFAEKDLQRLFGAHFKGGLDASTALQRYRECAYLRENLAEFYKRSGAYGMPWGIWDPKYIPVGLYTD
jgi:2-polyprenyl-3-methyl-5-hydroxy-6-metoxy-1,4-benzoquinol methylase